MKNLLRISNYLIVLLFCLFYAKLSAQEFEVFKGFSGEVTGKVKYSQDKGWFVVVELQSVIPLEGEASQYDAVIGEKVKIRTNWPTRKTVDPIISAYIKSLQPGQSFKHTVFNSRGNQLELSLDGNVPDWSRAAKLKADTAIAKSIKKYTIDDITGAVIDESKVDITILVDPAKATDSFNIVATLNEAFKKAYPKLVAGEGVKILIKPGTYRESIPHIDWKKGAAENALLIIEGSEPGSVVWSGSDLFESSSWKSLGGGLYSHDWEYDFGNYSLPWGAKDVLGHRSEMIFFNGKLLQQVMLEGYAYDKKAKPNYTYTGFIPASEALTPGSYGVAEMDENGNKIYLRLKANESLSRAKIEVAVRRELIDLRNKNNLVLRNLVVTHAANTLRDYGSHTAIRLQDNDNVFIDRCRFVWNNAHGLRPFGGLNWTIRDSVFNYNGYSGMQINQLENFKMLNCDTSMNNWRGSWADFYSWFIGGAKIHEGNGHYVKNHRSFGNLALGLWYDIHLYNIYIEGLVSAYNHSSSLFLELSEGPFLVDRSIIGPTLRASANPFLTSVITSFVMRDSIVFNNFQGKGIIDGIDANTNQKIKAAAAVKLQWYLRQDLHAGRKEIFPGLHRIENCIIVSDSNVQYLLLEKNGTNRKNAKYKMYAYEGDNNVFYASDDDLIFSYSNTAYKDVDVDLQAWQEVRNETNAIWMNPDFVNPASLDFRLKNTQSTLMESHPNLPYRNYSGQSGQVLSQLGAFMEMADYEPEQNSGMPPL